MASQAEQLAYHLSYSEFQLHFTHVFAIICFNNDYGSFRSCN